MESTILQDEIPPESENRNLTQSKIGATCDITVIECKILNLEAEYKLERQRLEQQKSLLVTKDLLHMSLHRKITCALSTLW